jgi:glycine/D-amino acid oxidase-like deaminating enzyme
VLTLFCAFGVRTGTRRDDLDIVVVGYLEGDDRRRVVEDGMLGAPAPERRRNAEAHAALFELGVEPLKLPKVASVSVMLLMVSARAATSPFDFTEIRVGGTAEVSGYSNHLHSARRATLDHSLTDLFPRGGNLAEATFWSGLRPMTPDGPPLIGATRYANLHLNTGHGTLGWTMACGSGRVLADLLSGRKPQIDAAELAMSRYEDRFA